MIESRELVVHWLIVFGRLKLDQRIKGDWGSPIPGVYNDPFEYVNYNPAVYGRELPYRPQLRLHAIFGVLLFHTRVYAGLQIAQSQILRCPDKEIAIIKIWI